MARMREDRGTLIGAMGLIAVAFTLALALPARADDGWVLRDNKGQVLEVIERSYGENFERRDPMTGIRRGAIVPGIGDRFSIRDQRGQTTGTVRKEWGRYVVRDMGGRMLYRIEPGIGDRLILRDARGRDQGLLERR